MLIDNAFLFSILLLVVSQQLVVREESKESLLAKDVNTKELLCTKWCTLWDSFTNSLALIEIITSWYYGGILSQVITKHEQFCTDKNQLHHGGMSNQAVSHKLTDWNNIIIINIIINKHGITKTW